MEISFLPFTSISSLGISPLKPASNEAAHLPNPSLKNSGFFLLDERHLSHVKKAKISNGEVSWRGFGIAVEESRNVLISWVLSIPGQRGEVAAWAAGSRTFGSALLCVGTAGCSDAEPEGSRVVKERLRNAALPTTASECF